MEFEKTLRARLYKKEVEIIERDFAYYYNQEILWYPTFDGIKNAYAIYMEHKMQGKPERDLYKILGEFEQELSAEDLTILKKQIEITAQEKAYIQYQELCQYGERKAAIKEVLMQRVLKSKLKDEEIEDVLKVLEEEAKRNSSFAKQYSYVKSFLTGAVFDNIQEKLEQKLLERVEIDFNQEINCGGYALKIDTCVFPRVQDFDTRVSGILETFPFVRLLGDTKLQQDEYLVLYRARGHGHHFIRIEDDGTVLEKDGAKAPQKFESWEDLKDAPEAVFAVKKEHDINYFEKQGSIAIPTESSMNFEETIWQAIQNRSNTFEYHNHSYTLKKANDETIYVCSNDEIIAEMLTNGQDYDVEVRSGKQAYVSNTQPKTPIIIKDGKLQENDREIN